MLLQSLRGFRCRLRGLPLPPGLHGLVDDLRVLEQVCAQDLEGNEIPISTGAATILANPNTPVVNTIEMRNTGVILKVLPHVYANGQIQMEIEQEISIFFFKQKTAYEMRT